MKLINHVREFSLWHSGLIIWLVSVAFLVQSPARQQWVKDLALPQRLRSDPWPGNFHMPRVQPKKEKKKINHVKVNNSVVFSIFIMMSNHCFCLVPKCFHHPRGIDGSNYSQFYSSPNPWQPTTSLLSVSLGVPILNSIL